MDVPFHWADVFAAEPLQGNPLALVPDADALNEAQLVGIAREFNQSETTFVINPTAGADIRLRSFTPGGHEVFGAGHNALGAWIWLAHAGRVGPGDYRQEIGDAVLPVRIVREGVRGSRFTMVQSSPGFRGRSVDRRALAEALGVPAAAFGRPAEVVSTGVAHLLVELTGRDAVDASRPDAQGLAAALARCGAEGCLVYATEAAADGVDAYARFFNPTVGIVEDPATGTAAGPLAALLVRDGLHPDGARVRVLQGALLGRPSLLEVAVEGERVELSGSGLVVASGVLHL